MKKQNARIGLMSSLFIHSTLFAIIWWGAHRTTPPTKATDELTHISMEMMTAILEQPQVAIAQPEPEAIIEPEPIPEPKEKPKPVQKPKPPQKKPTPKIKGIEKGEQIKQGVEAKNIPVAMQTDRLKIGESGTANRSQANEINAYKARLQKALQQQANNTYPQREKMLRKMGTVTLAFQILPSGKVTAIKIINSSGNHNLDMAAIRAAERIKMNMPPPKGFPTDITVPIKFSII